MLVNVDDGMFADKVSNRVHAQVSRLRMGDLLWSLSLLSRGTELP